MSQFIRTYAKDVAQLTNQPAPVMPKPDTDTSVALPEVDTSPVNRPDGVAKEFPQEKVELAKEDSAGIFAGPQAPQPSAPATPMPQPVPAEPNDMERREAVLARLREKIAARQAQAPEPIPQAPAPPPAPVPPPQPFIPSQAPEPTPVLPPAPLYPAPTYSPFPPAAPQPAAIQPPPETFIPPLGVIPEENAPAPLHTYTSDFADRIDRQQASTFSVLAAQSDAGAVTTTVSTRKRSGLIPVVLAVLLIVLGAGGLYAAYRFVGMGEEMEITLGVPSLILADEKMELSGPDYRQDLARAASQPLVEGNILITYVTVASSTSLGLRSAPQPGGALIRLLDLGAPDILLRNVDISSTVGVVSAGGQRNPFFILRVNSYERTFAGMLGWENRMRNDLELFYPAYADIIPEPEPVATTTATTTSDLIASPPALTLPSQAFSDAIVANIDVRVLKDALGRTLILYGYSDKETLIIARDEAAFMTLVARLAATRGGQ